MEKYIMNKINEPWAKDKDSILNAFNVDPSKGLSQQEIEIKLAELGPNILVEEKK